LSTPLAEADTLQMRKVAKLAEKPASPAPIGNRHDHCK
jgi:hypothetical protein